MALTGCAGASEVTFSHLHGLGFSADGEQLYAATHDGFAVYADGKWQVPDVPRHDYMGYAAVDDGFYSSGHPAAGSGLRNPLGLVKSTDGGKTLIPLGLEGEMDFHLMGAGYRSHAVYAFSPVEKAGLAFGLNYTLDDGKTWQRSAMEGLTGRLVQVAVHPTEVSVVAVATEEGLFLSTDYGDRFERIGDPAPVTAAAFSPDGGRLLFGFQQLFVYDLSTGQVEAVTAPPISNKDAFGYIAVNPVRPEEVVVSTFDGTIHRSADGMQTWEQIAAQGKGRVSK